MVRELLGDFILWHHAGRAYFSIRVDDHTEHHPVSSGAFGAILCKGWWRKFNSTLPPAATEDARKMVTALATFDNPAEVPHVRCARVGEAIYIDTGAADWSVIRVTRQGWEITRDCPVRFVRGSTTGELPKPERGGTDADWLSAFNVAESDLCLLKAACCDALKGSGGYWAVSFSGEHGTGKSTACERLVSLLDPQTACHLDTMPNSRNRKDFGITAQTRHLLAFDNISHIDSETSDTLCRVCTGGGIRTRQLYSDGGEFVLDFCRPLLLNGISDFVTRADLADRSLTIRLEPFRGQRVKSSVLAARWKAVSGRLLGTILDHLVAGLRSPEIETHDLRMAESASWAEQCGIVGIGAALSAAHEGGLRAILDNDPLAGRLLEWIECQTPVPSVNVGELLNKLKDGWFPPKDYKMPNSARGFGGWLKRIGPALRKVEKWDVNTHDGANNSRYVRVQRVD